MTIRKKIFLLAGTLLALFGMVVGVLAVIQKLDSDQIGNVVGYELPLSRIVAQFDVDTDRYELNILRALRLNPASADQLKAAAASKQELTDEMRSDVAAAGRLLQQAIQDRSYNAADRVDLARIEGSFKYLSRSLEEFLSVADRTMTALAEGNLWSSQSTLRHSVQTYLKFAAPSPILLIGRPGRSSRGNGSIPI